MELFEWCVNLHYCFAKLDVLEPKNLTAVQTGPGHGVPGALSGHKSRAAHHHDRGVKPLGGRPGPASVTILALQLVPEIHAQPDFLLTQACNEQRVRRDSCAIHEVVNACV